MDQQITISKDIIKYLYDNSSLFVDSNCLKCINIVEQNYIVDSIDRFITQSYFSELDVLPDSDKKNALRTLINGWLKEESKIFSINIENINAIEELSLKTDDKILLRINCDNELINKNLILSKNDDNELEIHNADSFINPDVQHRLKNIPTKIKLVKNREYRLEKIMKPFLRNAREILIFDPFIANPIALENIIKLFTIININAIITIKCFNSKLYCDFSSTKDIKNKKENYNKFITYIESRRNMNFSIDVNYIKRRKHYDRYIKTEKVKIDLPGGFDCLNNDKPKILDNYEIQEINMNWI